MRQRNPMLHRANRDYDAVGRVTKHDESMRGDNPAWEARCRPLLKALACPMTLDEIKAWARRESWPATMTEEALYWMQARGRVERGDDRKWRLTTVCLCARTAPAVNYGCPEHGSAR